LPQILPNQRDLSSRLLFYPDFDFIVKIVDGRVAELIVLGLGGMFEFLDIGSRFWFFNRVLDEIWKGGRVIHLLRNN
jgi:hypothetical protein